MLYSCVAGLDVADPSIREKDNGCEETLSCRTYDITTSPASPTESHPKRYPKGQETKTNNSNTKATKSRVKSSSRCMFLDTNLSEDEQADDTDKIRASGGPLNAFSKDWCGQQSKGTENGGNDCMDASFIPLSTTSEDSWTCPLSLDKLSPSNSDTETENFSTPRSVSQSLGPAKSPERSNNCSGMILKLRRMFGVGLNRKNVHYQAISDSGTFARPLLSQNDNEEEEVSREMDLHRSTPSVTHRWQRTGSFSHALRPLSRSSKRKHRSLLKIKYCPYLSACHSAEHRRRWVLRSAVQRAQRVIRFYYPDLVGKRIRHLYEEDDKSEVWYRGEVLRVHEAHSNPLKTIFEVRYDSEPEWKYYLELLIDYKNGWLKIED